MPQLISPKKRKWAQQFKPKRINGGVLNYNAAAQARYYSRLRSLILRMTDTTEKRLKKMFKGDDASEYFAQDASISSQARILTNALMDRFNELFSVNAKPYAEQMVEEADNSSTVSLGSSLKELSGGLTLKTDIFTPELRDVMNASVVENVGLIKSISSQYLQGVQGAVMRSITTGNGLKDLIPFLQKHKGITLRRARNIAFDQTRKAYGNINKIRMQKLGLKQFEWLHSAGGNEPRKLHIAMSGNIYNFDNPPVIDEKTGERGFPGQLINCKCRARPIITFEGE